MTVVRVLPWMAAGSLCDRLYYSSNFPTTTGAFSTSYGGNNDVFVTKVNASGTAPLIYSTFWVGVIMNLFRVGALPWMVAETPT